MQTIKLFAFLLCSFIASQTRSLSHTLLLLLFSYICSYYLRQLFLTKKKSNKKRTEQKLITIAYLLRVFKIIALRTYTFVHKLAHWLSLSFSCISCLSIWLWWRLFVCMQYLENIGHKLCFFVIVCFCFYLFFFIFYCFFALMPMT